MRDRNEPDLFSQAAKSSSETEQIAYLGDPNVIGALIRDAVEKVMYVQSQRDVSDADKVALLKSECRQLGTILLGTSRKADFSPIPNWNRPGDIDVFCAKWCGSAETSPQKRMEHAVLKLMMEMMELAKFAAKASEEEAKWQFHAIVQTYTGIFMGISPPMQALG